jgi:undecaprenyl-diphosphatase
MSVFLVLAVSAQAVVFLLVTLTIDRRRPDVRHLDGSPPTSSFPSGHTGASIALFLSSALLVLWFVKRRWLKILAITVLVAVPVLVAYSRLYRGMHHPTDIIGSLVNGLTCISIAAATVFGRRERDDDDHHTQARSSR